VLSTSLAYFGKVFYSNEIISLHNRQQHASALLASIIFLYQEGNEYYHSR